MPRRMAYYDYSNPELQPQAWTVTASTLGGLLLVISALLFVYVLVRAGSGAARPGAVHFQSHGLRNERTPAALNSFGLWVAMMIALTVVNYGYPIVQLAVLKDTSVPAIFVGGRDGDDRLYRGQPMVPIERRVARRPHGAVVSRRIRPAALGAARLHRGRLLGQHLPGGRIARQLGRRHGTDKADQAPPASFSSLRWAGRARATRSGAARRSRSSSAACAMARKA